MSMRSLAALGSILLSASTIAADRDPFLGSWHLDKPKSTIAHDPGVKSKEIVFAMTPDGGLITETLEMIATPDEHHVSRLPYAYGKFVAQPGPDIDAFLVEKTSPHVMRWTAQAKGKMVAQLQVDMSDDERQLTFRYLSSAADPSGAVTHDRYVYDRD